MFVFANFFTAIAKLLNIAFTLYTYVMIAHVVLSWIRVDPNNQIVQFIYRITEPVLGYVRQYVPPFAGLDFPPSSLSSCCSFCNPSLCALCLIWRIPFKMMNEILIWSVL